MITACALIVLIAVVIMPRVIRWRVQRKWFQYVFGFPVVARRHREYVWCVRRVDRALHDVLFALSECHDRLRTLREEIQTYPQCGVIVQSELDTVLTQITKHERDFWRKFRAAEDCGVPLRYHVLDARFGVPTLFFGRRDDIRATLGPHDAFREDLRAYDAETLSPDQAADTESQQFLKARV